MSNVTDVSPFIDEIISQTIALLSERAEFDEDTLGRLEQLLRSDDAVDYKSVVDVLSTCEERTL